MSKPVGGGTPEYSVTFSMENGSLAHIGTGTTDKQEHAKLEEMAQKILEDSKLQGVSASVTISKAKGLPGKREISVKVGQQHLELGKITDTARKRLFSSPDKMANKVIKEIVAPKTEQLFLMQLPYYRADVTSKEIAERFLYQRPQVGVVVRQLSPPRHGFVVHYNEMDGSLHSKQIFKHDREWFVENEHQTQNKNLKNLLTARFGIYQTAARMRFDGIPSQRQIKIMSRYYKQLDAQGEDWQPPNLSPDPKLRSPRGTAVKAGGQPYHANRVSMKQYGTFIAAQAPLGHAGTHGLLHRQEMFWRMATEHRSKVNQRGYIIDLSQKGYVPYYPNKIGQKSRYGPVTVTLKEQTNLDNKSHMVRSVYQVYDQANNRICHIVRIHQTNWKDHGIPDPADMQTIANYLKRVKINSPDVIPIIHGQQGVGRTGTAITYLALEARLAMGKKNTPDFVDQMIIDGKLQRGPQFVQNGDQHAFLQNYAKQRNQEPPANVAEFF